MNILWKLFVSAGILAAFSVPLMAQPFAVAGIVYRLTSATNGVTHGLRSHETGRDIAALADPRGLLTGPGSALLQTELKPEKHGELAVLEIIEVLPETWEQPSLRNHFSKGFGAYSGEGIEIRSADFARAPFAFNRAYDHDMGNALSRRQLLTGFDRLPLRLQPLMVQNQTIFLRWSAEAGVRYDVLFAPSLDTSFEVLTNVTRETSGDFSMKLHLLNPAGFYQLRIEQ